MVRLEFITDSLLTFTETLPGVIALKSETVANGVLLLNTFVPLEEIVTSGCITGRGQRGT